VEAIELTSQGTSKYEAVGANTFKGSRIKGRGTPDGFDAEGR